MLNKTTNFWSLAGAGAAIALVVGFGMVLTHRQKDLPVVNQPVSIMRAQTQTVGGIVRPRSDVQGRNKRDRAEPVNVTLNLKPDPTKLVSASFPYGHTPLILPETNSSAQSVFDSLKSERESARDSLNPYAQLEQFDLRKYREDPSFYLKKVEPARIWQSAQPGENVPRLAALSAKSYDILQGESVRLQVRTLPKAPATFLTFDLGAFQNNLSVITVESDNLGAATAVFTATPGSIAIARVLVSSPVASGNREFSVNIRLPQLP